MQTGVIKKMIQDKGFGFITVQGSEDVFFHITDCITPFAELREGQSVQFEEGSGPKGKKAVKVTVAA